jgi:hypothetical protein
MKLAGEQLRKKLAGVRQMIYWREEERHRRTLSRLVVGCCCWVALAGWPEP